MHQVTQALLAGALSLTPLIGAGAQVTKPRNPPSPGERLPAPSKITATQQPNGHIQVVWSPVEGAASYKLIRSVPPTPAAAVSLPNPSDTVYVDSDVNPGNSYYYVVHAVNQAGLGGLNASTPPVQPAAQAAASSATSDTGTAGDSDGSGSPAVPVPTNVVAKPYPYMQPTVSWQSSRGKGAHYLVERRQGRAAKGAWERVTGPLTRYGFWPCCEAHDRNPPWSVDLYYQVTAIDTAPPNYKSLPAVSNRINNWKISIEPSVINDLGLLTGDSVRVKGYPVGGPNLSNQKWVTLDSTVAYFDDFGGYVRTRNMGTTYIVASGMTPTGAFQSWIWRVTVSPRPR